MKKVARYGLLCLIVISLLGCVWNIFNVWRKIRTRLDLLSTPQLGGENIKKFRWDQRLQIQNLFHGIWTGSPMVITLGQQYNIREKPIVVFIPSPALLQKNKQASDWVRVRWMGRRWRKHLYLRGVELTRFALFYCFLVREKLRLQVYIYV